MRKQVKTSELNSALHSACANDPYRTWAINRPISGGTQYELSVNGIIVYKGTKKELYSFLKGYTAIQYATPIDKLM